MCVSLGDVVCRGESCGHVFLEVQGFADPVCNIVTTALRSVLLPCRDFGASFRAAVKPPDRHIVHSETRWKLVRVVTFAAHKPAMKLRAVDFDRNQSDSMGLIRGSSVHH
ncbi:hypothetical protein ILYODFUR_028024 [Ilyodon furcidens]|uniref:Uncharacterized protein n=1 Tax=Ilyodon furcidens TaxID=33524 RepID=A0ABV0SPV7_9TELE